MVKVSSDELEFITGKKEESKAIQSLFIGNVQYVILTQGALGSTFFSKAGLSLHMPGFKVDVKDTTGAGDAFIGAFLSEMIKKDLVFSEENVSNALRIANAKAALTTTQFGGMSAIPTESEFEALFND